MKVSRVGCTVCTRLVVTTRTDCCLYFIWWRFFSSSDYVVSSKMVITWIMNWKGCGRKQSWPNLRYYSAIRLEQAAEPLAREKIFLTSGINCCHNFPSQRVLLFWAYLKIYAISTTSHTHTHTHTHTHIHTYIYICICIMYVCMHVCVCVCIYIYIISVWWPEDKNNSNVAHTCRKRLPKWGTQCLGV
jgi:hypothetical protein